MQKILMSTLLLTLVNFPNVSPAQFPRPGFGAPLQSKQQDDYDYWIRRKERDYEEALARLRTKQPVEKSAKELGIESAKRGDKKNTNPYAQDYFNWLIGWEEGQEAKPIKKKAKVSK